MKLNKLIFFLVIVLISSYSCNTREDVKQYAAKEIYPDDTLLQSIEIKKRAMIVIAHDDDMCAMSGTVSKLNKEGWEIAVLSFTGSPERNAAQKDACRDILDTVMFVNLTPEQYRNDLGGEQVAYHSIPKKKFSSVFNKTIVENEFIAAINEFNPTVIFSLDNEIGGYGHPEHVFISQMVVDLAKEKRISPAYIYQSVFTNHMENTIMARHSKRMKSWGFPGDEWEQAKIIYEVDGMPEPTVQIQIKSEAEQKMQYLRSYNERERKTIGFFLPEFEKYDAEEYFTIFDKEYFRILEFD